MRLFLLQYVPIYCFPSGSNKPNQPKEKKSDETIAKAISFFRSELFKIPTILYLLMSLIAHIFERIVFRIPNLEFWIFIFVFSTGWKQQQTEIDRRSRWQPNYSKFRSDRGNTWLHPNYSTSDVNQNLTDHRKDEMC